MPTAPRFRKFCKLVFATNDDITIRKRRPRPSRPTEPRSAADAVVAGEHPVQAPGDAAGDEHPVGGRRRRHRLPVGAQLVARVGVRPADRDPAVAESPAADRDRGSEELAGDLLAGIDGDAGASRRSPRVSTSSALPPSTRPNSSPSSTTTPSSSPRTRRRRPASNVDVDALLPTSNAAALPAGATTPSLRTTTPTADWDAAIKFDDAHDGSPWSAANAQLQRLLPRDRHPFRIRGRPAARHQGQRRLQRLQGRRPRHQHPDRSLSRAASSPAPIRRRSTPTPSTTSGLTDFGDYQPADEPTAWFVSPVGPQGRVEGVLALQFPISKINTADDDRRPLGGLRHGHHR